MAGLSNFQNDRSPSILDYTGGRPRYQVLYEDRQRDLRNAERRQVIKQQSAQKRNSLVDSLMVAKAIIDDHARNKEYEEKALERRQKIKQNSEFSSGRLGQKKRRLSFAEEVQNACGVITPNWQDNERQEQSKAKRRKIKHEISGKRRPSLLDEIQVAKSVIMESPKKYVLHPRLVEEVRNTLDHSWTGKVQP